MGRSNHTWKRHCDTAGALAAVLVLALPAQASTAPHATGPHLTATLVGPLEAGTTAHLAVHWDGPPGALLDAWVDMDGDGAPDPQELIADGRPLSRAIEVVSFDLAPASRVVSEPRVWAALRTSGEPEGRDARPTIAAATRRDPCAWRSGFTTAGLDGNVLAMAVFDNGFGPGLYVGGSFDTAGGATMNGLARWDGWAWSALAGPSGVGVSGGDVLVLEVHDDGFGPALYAGGTFHGAGGVPVSHIARWDGSSWSALTGPSGYGTNGDVVALATYDDGTGPALFVGGDFDYAGGVEVTNIARWDGSAWSALTGPSGTGVDLRVNALAVFDDGSGPALYAGGWISSAGGIPSSYIAVWRCVRETIFTDGFEGASTAGWSLTEP